MTPINDSQSCCLFYYARLMGYYLTRLMTALDHIFDRWHIYGGSLIKEGYNWIETSVRAEYFASKTYAVSQKVRDYVAAHFKKLSMPQTIQLKQPEGKCQGASTTFLAQWHRTHDIGDTTLTWDVCQRQELFEASFPETILEQDQTDVVWESTKFSCALAGLEMSWGEVGVYTAIENRLAQAQDGTYFFSFPSGTGFHTVGVIVAGDTRYLYDPNYGVSQLDKDTLPKTLSKLCSYSLGWLKSGDKKKPLYTLAQVVPMAVDPQLLIDTTASTAPQQP